MSRLAPIFGIDISGHQDAFDVAAAARQGYRFAFVKATQGEDFTNEDYKVQIARATQYMDVVGVYHFLDESASPERQADHFYRRIRPARGKLIAVDFESYGDLSPTNETLERFIKALRMHVGRHPIILYTGPGFWNSGTPSGAFSRYGADVLWSASYPNDNASHDRPRDYYQNVKQWGWLAVGGKEPVFWQFTGRGLVGNPGQYVDVDAYSGTLAELKALTRAPVFPVEPVEPEIVLKSGLGKDGDSSIGYVRDHPTNYLWRPDVGKWTHELANDPEFRGKVWINTYYHHPPGWNRDATSFDVWGFGGRGDPIGTDLGNRMFQRIFNDPDPPDIWWTIWNRRMWSRLGGWESSPPGPPDSDPAHTKHIHVTVLD